MLYSEVIGRKVVSTSTATTVGLIGTLVLEPGQQRAVALSLTKTSGPGTMLPWQNIAAFGADALTVASDQALVSDEHLAALDNKAHSILRKRVLTTEGYDVGTVTDVEFDETDGKIVTLVLERYRWDGQLLIGVGSYAVIVKPQRLEAPADLVQSAPALQHP